MTIFYLSIIYIVGILMTAVFLGYREDCDKKVENILVGWIFSMFWPLFLFCILLTSIPFENLSILFTWPFKLGRRIRNRHIADRERIIGLSAGKIKWDSEEG